jgi:hypothetical protein
VYGQPKSVRLVEFSEHKIADNEINALCVSNCRKI